MEAQILQLLKKHHFLTVFEISQATGIKHSTITARLDTLAGVGLVYKTPVKVMPKGAKRNYTNYGYVYIPEKRKLYGELYRLDIAIRKCKAIRKNENLTFTYAFVVAAEKELSHLKQQLSDVKEELQYYPA